MYVGSRFGCSTVDSGSGAAGAAVGSGSASTNVSVCQADARNNDIKIEHLLWPEKGFYLPWCLHNAGELLQAVGALLTFSEEDSFHHMLYSSQTILH